MSLCSSVCFRWPTPGGAAFRDDFNRPNGKVGNGWAIQTDGTIKAQIVDNEVLIAGTQGTDWVRSGISRPISDETKISFDFKADNNFNVHIRVDAAASSAFVEIFAWPGGPFSYASSPNGGWPDWVEITGSNMVAGRYNTFVLEQKDTVFTATLNGKMVGTVTNAGFTTIESVLIASDAPANTTGSLHIDNVQIGVVIPGKARDPSPALDGVDVPRDVVLAWTAGEYANKHNVYLGTSFEDVNKADVTQAVSRGQTGTTFKPAGLLEYGRIYYWRVDEVNTPPSSTVFKGDIWSFITQTEGIPLLPSHTYYIATDGSDKYPGSQTRPWRTVDHAAQVIEPGDTVVILGGVYRVPGLVFGPAGGSFDQMTTYKSAPGARVIFCSADGGIPGVYMSDFVRVEGMWFDGCFVAPGGSPIGHGKEIINCTIFRSDGGIVIGSLESLLVYGNRFIHTGSTPYGHGIYLSGGGPIGSRSNHVIVDNNIFIHGEGWGIHGWHGARSMIITRNFISRHDNGIVMDGSDHLIANNLVWKCGPGGVGISLSGEDFVVARKPL